MLAAVVSSAPARCRPHAFTPGFTLVEALVALCVVALGLAGAATLQLRSQRAALEAARLSAGVQLAAALAERMRANPGVAAYVSFDYDASSSPPPPAAHCYANASCAPDALARFDLYETALAMAASLPQGRIVVCRDGGAAGPPAWPCDGRAGAPVVIKLGWADGPVVLLPVGTP